MKTILSDYLMRRIWSSVRHRLRSGALCLARWFRALKGYRLSPEPFLSVDLWPKFASVAVFDRDSHAKVQSALETQPDPLLFIETRCVFSYVDLLLASARPYRLLTTCNDDISVPFLYFPCEDPETCTKMTRILESECLVRWYAKNPGLVHPKLQPLPLGPKWQWKSNEFGGEDKSKIWRTYRKYCGNPGERFRDAGGRKKKLLYFNFGDTTDEPFYRAHAAVRARLKEILLERFPWNPNEEFEYYLKTLGEYKFCLSPPGRGVDTHRTWEALMSGTIPIMLSTPLDGLFQDLPVLIIEDWSVITNDFLNVAYEEIHQRDYNFDICYSEYWERLLTVAGGSPGTPA